MSIRNWLIGMAMLLLTVVAVNAQTTRRPAADGQKERTEKRTAEDVRGHAEEKSQGAAFSGRGKGGEKNLREKREKRHKKHAGHRGPRGSRPYPEKDGEAQPQTQPRPDNAPSPAPAPQRRAGERPTSGAEPKSSGRRQ